MTFLFHTARYSVRIALGASDMAACQRLRHLCFFGVSGVDQDRFDGVCRHLMVEGPDGKLVATARLFQMQNGSDVNLSYAAQSYDLHNLYGVDAPMIELGRFCIAPDVLDVDVLRVAWGALTQIVDETGTQMLFGCTSFAGTDPAPYGRVFARLQARHLGPENLRPKPSAAHIVPFSDVPTGQRAPMPPLLRTYLAMGGWVSDHAVVDNAMNTLHVFTCLEVARVPPTRAAALRALAHGRDLS